jgi:hypothetical protein
MVIPRFDVGNVRRGLTSLAVAFALAAFGVADASAQNTGTVTGLVRDAVSLQPLAGAQVSVARARGSAGW